MYLDPPDHAVALRVDEKSRVQAPHRRRPLLPMGPDRVVGHVEGATDDYARRGATTLFAALDIATGNPVTQCETRPRHREFLAFLRRVDRNVSDGFDVHLVIDDDAPHKHAKVKAWLAERPRYHVHYAPMDAS